MSKYTDTSSKDANGTSGAVDGTSTEVPTAIIRKQVRWRLAVMAWTFSECMAFGFLSTVGAMRWSLFEVSCTLLGPLAAVTAIPRFQFHSLLGNVGFVLLFILLAALPFLHPYHPRRWTLIISAMTWLLWPWLGFAFTINHM
jgi:hypothetical protein